MLRRRLSDKKAEFVDPVLGVNLRDSLEDLQPGEAERMTNCFYDGGTRKRYGSSRITTTSRGAFRGRGGIRVYPLLAVKFRLVAFDINVVTVSDAGAVGTVTFTLTSDQDTFFANWSITDKTYVCNKSNVLGQISAAQVFTTVTGVNIPSSPTMALPFLDRLFAIQGDGVWSTDPRTDATWSPNSSTWAIYRPSAGTGVPTAIHLHSFSGATNSPRAQLLIFQESSLTTLIGQDFGSDVTLATPPTTWDASMTLLSPDIGTLSPASLVTVPGVGTFWFTQDANVGWLPFFTSIPKLIGDKLFSNRQAISGLNNVNFSQLSQVRMVYHDRKLKLFLPVGSNAYSTIQYWLDLRQLQNVAVLSDTSKVSWSGPHTGQSLSAVWVESAGADNNALYACEGNTTVGLYVYRLDDLAVYTDVVGTTTVAVEQDYRSYYHDFGAPAYEKWIPDVRFDFSGRGQHATVALNDLHGNSVSGLLILDNTGAVFTTASTTYGTGLKYGTSVKYGHTIQPYIGHVAVDSQVTTAVLGDALQVQVTHNVGSFTINRIVPQVQIRRTQPVG